MATFFLLVLAMGLTAGLVFVSVRLAEVKREFEREKREGEKELRLLEKDHRERLARYRGLDDVERFRDSVLQQTRDLESKSERLMQNVEALEAQLGLATSAKQKGEALANLERQERELAARVHALRSDLLAVEEAVEVQSFGFYAPHYDFEDSDLYMRRLKHVRDMQKDLIKREGATHCPKTWTVDGSEAKGRQMIREQAKLMLRAFNGEADAATSKVKYSNVLNMEKRVQRSFETINKLGKTKDIAIEQSYLNLRLEELRLVHEHREKVQAEKEEQKRVKELMREEEQARKEIERAQADAEKEEVRQQAALDKARRELHEKTGAQHEKLAALVKKLEEELKEAIDRKAKAIARAQLTRSGHVYVISNVGSFGERVYKIGMTRRLEPLLRVKELGDASVPFLFDVHAMIYSEDAPNLESQLHTRFNHLRVNRVNQRKEFFRVDLEEIIDAVGELHGEITFVKTAHAEEYRKSLAMEDSERSSKQAAVALEIPQAASV